MGVHVLANPARDERQTSRVPFRGEFEYECDAEKGRATWCSVSQDGACIRIGRYLRPGRVLRIRYYTLEMTAQVAWCRPTADGEGFVAGLHVLNGGPEASLLTLAAVVRRLVA